MRNPTSPAPSTNPIVGIPLPPSTISRPLAQKFP